MIPEITIDNIFSYYVSIIGFTGDIWGGTFLGNPGKDLVNLEKGESYPIGLWIVADYSAAHLTSRVVQIMIQDQRNFQNLTGIGGSICLLIFLNCICVTCALIFAVC